MAKMQRKNILKMVQLAMLTALVVVLQLIGASIPLGAIPLTFVLVPIVIGAFVIGPWGGAFLGFVFGLITVIQTPQNFVLMSLFESNPGAYVVLAMGKAIISAWLCGLIYKYLTMAFKGKLKYLTAVIASVSLPIINTGIFILGMFLFFFDEAAIMPTLFADKGLFIGLQGGFEVIILGLVGFNFVGEFLVNLVLTPAIVRIADIVGSKFVNKKDKVKKTKEKKIKEKKIKAKKIKEKVAEKENTVTEQPEQTEDASSAENNIENN